MAPGSTVSVMSKEANAFRVPAKQARTAVPADLPAAIAGVRTVLSEGSLHGVGPIAIGGGTTLLDPERDAQTWLREAARTGPIERAALSHLVSLSAAIVADDAVLESAERTTTND